MQRVCDVGEEAGESSCWRAVAGGDGGRALVIPVSADFARCGRHAKWAYATIIVALSDQLAAALPAREAAISSSLSSFVAAAPEPGNGLAAVTT